MKYLLVLMVALTVIMGAVGPRETLDKKLYYTGPQAEALLSSFDPATRHAYVLNEIVDFGFLFSYSAFLCLGFAKAFPQRRRMWKWALVPGAFDGVETGFALYAAQVDGPHGFLSWLGIITFLKWFSGAIVVSVFLLGAWRRRGQTP